MLRKLLYSLSISLFFFLVFYKIYNNYNIYNPVLSDSLKKSLSPIAKDVKVFARVGEYFFNEISGWTSPFAEVTLSAPGLARKTTADECGFFAFYYIPVPDNLVEFCLISQDINMLPSFPVCLPAPEKNTDTVIKNILLPPSLSLESGKIPAGGTTKASGMTIPNAEIHVHLFTQQNFSFWAKITNAIGKTYFVRFFQLLRKLKFATTITKSAYALSLPNLKIKSNEYGHFEFSLPAVAPSSNRVFVNSLSNLGDPSILAYSPKSNTLSFQVLGIWGLFQLFLSFFFHEAGKFFGSLRSNPLNLILLEILVLLGIIILLLARRSKKTKLTKAKRDAKRD